LYGFHLHFISPLIYPKTMSDLQKKTCFSYFLQKKKKTFF
jgi:hypothetical protein